MGAVGGRVLVFKVCVSVWVWVWQGFGGAGLAGAARTSWSLRDGLFWGLGTLGTSPWVLVAELALGVELSLGLVFGLFIFAFVYVVFFLSYVSFLCVSGCFCLVQCRKSGNASAHCMKGQGNEVKQK